MNEHRGMVNRIVAQRAIEAFSESDICCQRTSVSFVDAVFEIFGALCNGLPLVIIPAAVVSDSGEMAALIARRHVTRLVTVPSLARSMLEDAQTMRNLSELRSWTLSGEEVRADLLMKLQRHLPNCEFIIQYGSSEVSSDAAIYKSRSFEGERVPIGRPVPNSCVYILDQHGEPVPRGVTGEIHVAGVCVGRGYLNRPEMTAVRFLPDRFSAHNRARLYKTGDLGRWRADGMLEYLGRNDQQVKIRGFRIELGEIESQLLIHSEVHEAVVVAREDAPGEKRLVAYLTLRDGSCQNVVGMPKLALPPQDGTSLTLANGSPSVRALRSHLKARLPAYMLPAAFVVLGEMPLTPNGKLDRRGLPAPDAQALSNSEYEAPQGEIEQVVAGIWKEVLGVECVGRNDNFLELGGHSLLATQAVARIRSSLSIELPIRILFDFPTVKQLSAQVGDIRQARLLHKIAVGGDEIEQLLERVASMSESRVQELMTELRKGGTL
jgi:acyl-coenzyme A synthetase/AMP-(fatty) acid ligase/acyl carrier protein